MEKIRKQKAVVYCIQEQKLLVFRHVDYSFEEVGIQVPAGSIRDGEIPEKAALRELQEETGKQGFVIKKLLGIAEYDITPYRYEIQERHFFLAVPIDPLPERWQSAELHDGKQEPTRLECFWIPLTAAHILQAGQGALLGKLFD